MWRQRETSHSTGQAAVEPLREMPAAPAPVRRVNSAIGPTIRITGSVFSEEDLTISGSVSGPVVVDSHRLFVTHGASVIGDISADAITIAGTVTGRVAATELVEVLASAQVDGDVTAPRIAVRDGAVIDGRVDTVKAKPAQQHFPIAV